MNVCRWSTVGCLGKSPPGKSFKELRSKKWDFLHFETKLEC